MSQLHECIILMQNYFQFPNTEDKDQIEDLLEKLSNSNDGQENIDALIQLWEKHKNQIRKGDTAQKALMQLQSSFEHDRDGEYWKLKNENVLLKMQQDCKQRKERKIENDAQMFLRQAEEIQQYKQIVKQLKNDFNHKEKIYKEDNRRLQEQVEHFKRNAKTANVKQIEEENKGLREYTQQLQCKQIQLEDQLLKQQNQITDTKELTKLKHEIQQLQKENKSLEDKIHELYDQLELSKQNNLENQVEQLEKKITITNLKMQQLTDENKLLSKKMEQIKQQNIILSDKLSEPLNIRVLPDIKGSSYFNCVMHLIETIQPLTNIMTNNDKVSQIILKFVSYIRKETDEYSESLAKQLIKDLTVDLQNDNRANDLLFQIIDHFSKVLPKDDNPKSQIASIIQAQDSEIYNLFFFLQRVFSLETEIQPNEVPLINSIKHIRYIEGNQKGNFSEYIQELIKYEGNENKIEDGESDFNFLIFPDFLILNVCELSLAKADITIQQTIPGKCLNQSINDIEYNLIAVVHCQEGLDKQPLYSITVQRNNIWGQITTDCASLVKIEEILTFKKPYNDKELLIYRKSRI